MVIQEHVRHDPEDETRRLRRGLPGDQEGKISNFLLFFTNYSLDDFKNIFRLQ